jgi:hypothetical protein
VRSQSLQLPILAYSPKHSCSRPLQGLQEASKVSLQWSRPHKATGPSNLYNWMQDSNTSERRALWPKCSVGRRTWNQACSCSLAIENVLKSPKDHICYLHTHTSNCHGAKLTISTKRPDLAKNTYELSSATTSSGLRRLYSGQGQMR